MAARWRLAVLAGLLAAGLLSVAADRPLHRPAASLEASAAPSLDDRDVYRRIVVRMRGGEGYYAAATTELRANHFPLRPALTIRPPTLAWIEARLGSDGACLALLLALVVGTVGAWLSALRRATFAVRLLISAALMAGLANVAAPGSLFLHEAWATTLVTAALGLLEWPLAAALLFAAALAIRETALPFAGAAFLVALHRRDGRAAAMLGGAMAATACFWAWHWHLATLAVGPADPVSPGWLGLQGWRLVISAATQWNVALAVLPRWLGAAVVPAALAGLWSVRAAAARAAAIGTTAFVLALPVLGRADNDYWGVMIAPLLLAGLAWRGGRAISSRRGPGAGTAGSPATTAAGKAPTAGR